MNLLHFGDVEGRAVEEAIQVEELQFDRGLGLRMEVEGVVVVQG